MRLQRRAFLKSAATARAERSLAGVFPIAFTPARPDGTLDHDGDGRIRTRR
jgi:hypothetical protein